MKSILTFLCVIAYYSSASEARPSLSSLPTDFAVPKKVTLSVDYTSPRVLFPQLLAQALPAQPEREYTIAQGMVDGPIYAERISSGEHFVGGLVVGFFTGLIGTGAGYFLIGPSQLDARALLAVEGKGSEYFLGFETGWNKKTRSKKRNAFFGGGLLGTAGRNVSRTLRHFGG